MSKTSPTTANARRVYNFHRARARSKHQAKAPSAKAAGMKLTRTTKNRIPSTTTCESGVFVSLFSLWCVLLLVHRTLLFVKTSPKYYTNKTSVSQNNATEPTAQPWIPTQQASTISFTDKDAIEAIEAIEVNDVNSTEALLANASVLQEFPTYVPTVPQEFLPTSVRRARSKSPYFLKLYKLGYGIVPTRKHKHNTGKIIFKEIPPEPTPPIKSANYLKYEQAVGRQVNVRKLYPPSQMNFGPEIETCISKRNAAPRLVKFQTGSDGTIICRCGFTNVEYRYRGVHTLAALTDTFFSTSKIAKDIRHLHTLADKCLHTSCGTHVHLSHSLVTRDSHPSFGHVVENLWRSEQDHWINKWYIFQNRHESSEYCRPNIDYFNEKDSMFRWAGDYGVRGLSNTWHFELRGLGELVGPNAASQGDPVTRLALYMKDMETFMYDALEIYEQRKRKMKAKKYYADYIAYQQQVVEYERNKIMYYESVCQSYQRNSLLLQVRVQMSIC